jgi:hypothetical protein
LLEYTVTLCPAAFHKTPSAVPNPQPRIKMSAILFNPQFIFVPRN